MNMDKIHINLCKYLQLVYKMMAVYTFNSQLKDASFINLLEVRITDVLLYFNSFVISTLST